MCNLIGPVEMLEALYASRGGAEYLGEAVSVATHMLQTAALAERSGAADALVAAALLHDVGHITAPTSHSTDARHEELGADFLSEWFPEEVTAPIRLHVAAKRYLCAVEPQYYDQLSAASRHSLALQGGQMRDDEAQAFAQLPGATGAVAVRRWDDAAKDPGVPTPEFAHFKPILRRLMRWPACSTSALRSRGS